MRFLHLRGILSRQESGRVKPSVNYKQNGSKIKHLTMFINRFLVMKTFFYDLIRCFCCLKHFVIDASVLCTRCRAVNFTRFSVLRSINNSSAASESEKSSINSRVDDQERFDSAT